LSNDIDTSVLQFAAAAPTAAASPSSMPARTQLLFDEVYSEHAQMVLSLLHRLGVPSSDVQDVAQEVFLAVHAKLPSFEWRSKPSTWIHGICLRKFGDYRRKACRRRENLTAEPPECMGGEGPEELLRDQQHVELLQQAIAAMPEKLIQIFVLYEVEELPMAEVVAIVGCPLFTGYTRHKKAVATVKAFFRKHQRLSRS
jgi:RNA polymerase sigma-70 factor (ECF subfamily)